MVHLPPLPGAPGYKGDLNAVMDHALHDARTLADAGVHGLLVENFHDYPFYPETKEPETVAAMTRIAVELRRVVALPLGVQVLRNSWQSSLAIAAAVGGAFIRVNVLTEAMVTDQGLITGVAHLALRYRRFIGAESVRIMADVYSKHGAPVARRPLGIVAQDLVSRGRADAVIVSGEHSGDPPRAEDLEEVRRAVPDTPVVLGSGMTVDTVDLLRYADACIFGYGAKRGGDMASPVDAQLARTFMQRVARLGGRTP
jgi:membrane complex biogenesis BtpA family protein